MVSSRSETMWTPSLVTHANNLKDIEVLLQYATDDCVLSTSREALRCLANIMLLQTSSRQMVADSGYMDKLAERYKVEFATFYLRENEKLTDVLD